jgi:glycyl-tRNA synthetase alpha subunit
MEADYKEPSSATMASSDNIDITKLFAALSSQIMVQNSNLQDQIMRNDSKMSAEFQTVVQANEEFKSEVRFELEDIRRLFNQLQNVTNPSTTLISPQVSSSTFNQVVPSSSRAWYFCHYGSNAFTSMARTI